MLRTMNQGLWWLQRRCLNTLGFFPHVKENNGSSGLVCERFLALLSVPSLCLAELFRVKQQRTPFTEMLYRLQHCACSTACCFQVLLWPGGYLIIINSLWICVFQVIFTGFIDIVLLHTAAFFQKLQTAIRNDNDNVANCKRINIPNFWYSSCVTSVWKSGDFLKKDTFHPTLSLDR